MFENWNRYYDPNIGRYLQPEPMLQDPKWVAARPKEGMSTPAYSYANNNPLHFTDPTGLYSWKVDCSDLKIKWKHASIGRQRPGEARYPGSNACSDCYDISAQHRVACTPGVRNGSAIVTGLTSEECACLARLKDEICGWALNRGCTPDEPPACFPDKEPIYVRR